MAPLSTITTTTSVHTTSLNKDRHVTFSLSQGRVPSFTTKRKNARVVRITADLGVDTSVVKPADDVLSRRSFPRSFVFGAGTSSYQIEGAWNEDGKGPSIWDHFCHTYPERIKNKSNGDVAVNSYHLYEEDVKMLKAMGMDAYRFSICWPRILPKGSLQGGINPDGIKYYNNLINKLLENGIKPYVTLFHWEVPQALEEEYGGFLSGRIVKDFRDFAGVCFKEFGDRVKHWYTLNEPYVFCSNAYGVGKHAPGRCSSTLECALPIGNSLEEPYIAGHHQILAHAETARLYRKKYQGQQEGQIGIALVSMGYEPYETNRFDQQAQDRSIDFHLGWFFEPLVRGDYPFNMRALIGDRLKYFTKEEEKLITGSYDIIGLNYYTSRFADGIAISPDFAPVQNKQDIYANHLTTGVTGQPIGPQTGTDWIFSYPDGLKNLLMLIKDRYYNPPVYITENGMGDVDEGDLPMEDAINDTVRCEYLKAHIAKVREAMKEGANVKGHFTWSLLDNFEWHQGYTHRFGLIYVDYKDNYKRHMKESAKWFAQFNGKNINRR